MKITESLGFPRSLPFEVSRRMTLFYYDTVCYSVTTGPHTVTCKKSGYSDASQAVNVEPNKTASASITLACNKGSLRVESSPEQGADIYLNSEKAFQYTPHVFESLTPGTFYEISVQKIGYIDPAPQTKTIEACVEASAIFNLDKCQADLEGEATFYAANWKDGTAPIQVPRGGQTWYAPYQYRNNGPNSSDIIIEFWISSDTTLDGSDYLLSSKNLEILATGDSAWKSKQMFIDVPISAPTGNYYIFFKITSSSYKCIDSSLSNNVHRYGDGTNMFTIY